MKKTTRLAVGLLVLNVACSPMDEQEGHCGEFERLVKETTTRGGLDKIADYDGGMNYTFFKERMYWRQGANSTTNACKIDITFMPIIGMAEALRRLDNGDDPRSPYDRIVNSSESYFEHVFSD